MKEFKNIKGIQSMTVEELSFELERGGRFVIYEYCISLIYVTLTKTSEDVYFVRAGESRVVKGLNFVGLSLLFGLWGLPWGPLLTLFAIIRNLSGGIDVTADVVAYLQAREYFKHNEKASVHKRGV